MEEFDNYRPYVEVEQEQEEPDFPYYEEENTIDEVINVADNSEGADEELQEDLATEESAQEDNINISFFLADALRQKGIIDLDNVPEDITEEQVVDLYARSHEDRIQQQILSTLQQRGITENNLQIAMAIENGYSPEFLLEQNRYRAFAELAKQEDVAEDVKKQVVTQWLTSRDLFEDEIKERQETYELNEEIFEKDYERALGFFDAKRKEFERENELLAIEREKATLDLQRRNRELLTNVETKGVIGSEKLTATQLEDFRRAIRLQEEIIEVNGQPYKASKFDKFMYDIQNDFETQLLAFKLMMFRETDKKIIEEKAKSEAEDSLFKGLNGRINKIPQNTGSQSTQRKGSDGRVYDIPKNAKVVTLR